jgi:hypothetical protein
MMGSARLPLAAAAVAIEDQVVVISERPAAALA